MKLKEMKLLNLDKDIIMEQIYSFVKSYVTAFITIAYFADINGIDVYTLPFLISSAKASGLVVVRNLYKLLTEKE